MSEPVSVRRVFGGGPFVEVGEPSVAVVDEGRGLLAVGGELGFLQGAGDEYRLGVYGLGDLRCRLLVTVGWTVRAVAFHPELPLVAVGVGDYDGGFMFDGQLLLVDLETGRVVHALYGSREVLDVRWVDGRRLDLVLAPMADDGNPHVHQTGCFVSFERDDWSAVEARTLRHSARDEQWRDRPRPDRAQAARTLVDGLCAERGLRRVSRRQVRAVECLGDGRVLATLEGVLLECWLPSGERAWSVPDDGEGGHELRVLPDQRSVWVDAARPWVWAAGQWQEPSCAVARLSCEDGRTLTRGVAFVTPAQCADEVTATLGPAHPGFTIRRSRELLFVQVGDEGGKWVTTVAPESGSGPVVRRLFPLEWGPEQGGRLSGGPGVRVGDALVHAGAFHDGRGVLPGYSFVACRSFPDGAVRWTYTDDVPVTAVDTDGESVLVAFESGVVTALGVADGRERWRRRIEVGGVPVVPLSLGMDGVGRLVVGTFDGRVLDCVVEGVPS